MLKNLNSKMYLLTAVIWFFGASMWSLSISEGPIPFAMFIISMILGTVNTVIGVYGK